MDKFLVWLLYKLRRLELWLEEQTGLDAYEVYSTALDDLYDGELAHLKMMAAAYYEKTKIDPVNVRLYVTRWSEGGKRIKTYEFAQDLD